MIHPSKAPDNDSNKPSLGSEAIRLLLAGFIFLLGPALIAGIVFFVINQSNSDRADISGRAEGYLDRKSSQVTVSYGKKTLKARSGQTASIACYSGWDNVQRTSRTKTIVSQDAVSWTVTEEVGRHLALGGYCLTRFADGASIKSETYSGGYQWPGWNTCISQKLPCEAEFKSGRQGQGFAPSYMDPHHI